MSANPSLICRRLGQMRGDRMPHEQAWRDCFDYSFPLRADGLNGQIIDAQVGQSKKAQLLDSTSTDSCRTLASGLMSGLTPASARWVALDVQDEDDEGRRWLDEAADDMWKNIHAGNFDSEAFEACLDVVAAGWFALFVDEQEDGSLTFNQWPISELYCATSRAGGPVDIVYRDYQLTAEQAVAEFGAKVSSSTRDLAEKDPGKKVDFVHAIYPRQVSVVGAKRAVNMPIASCHVEKAPQILVRESGYQEMPVIVARWQRLPRSVYAVGPMWDALPDTRELNELVALEKSAIEMAVSPPLMAVDDGVLNPKLVTVGPRKMIVVSSTDSIKPLYDGAQVDIAWTAKDKLQAAIRRVLMADQLQPQDGPAMTATEVHVRVGLIRQLLGPVYGRMQAEYLQPLIERVFGLRYRRGAFGEVPESLAGRDFTVRYISPLARAQRLEDVTATERFFANVGAMAQAKPEVLDNIDGDEAVRVLAEGLGVPDKVVKRMDDVVAFREAKQKQAAQDQANAALQQVAQPIAVTAGQELAKQQIGVAA